MVAVLNTFAIYEQFRSVLGEERAKDFAETIGKMIDDAKNAATKDDVRLLRESAEANTSRLEAADLIDTIEPTVGEVAVDDFLRADVVATGTLDGTPTYLVGEISYTAHEDDVMRAARRTACLRKAGLPAIGLVACEKIPPQTTEYARKEGVFVWVDGRVVAPESPPQSPLA